MSRVFKIYEGECVEGERGVKLAREGKRNSYRVSLLPPLFFSFFFLWLAKESRRYLKPFRQNNVYAGEREVHATKKALHSLSNTLHLIVFEVFSPALQLPRIYFGIIIIFVVRRSLLASFPTGKEDWLAGWLTPSSDSSTSSDS